MIYTDRKYNRQREVSREEHIALLERDRDELADRVFDDPGSRTPENISRLNYLSSQVEIMRGNRIINF